MKYKVILFYKYTKIDDPEGLKKAQIELLCSLNLKGRMIIAKEGINGTFEGTTDAVERYMEYMKRQEGFSDIHWKISYGTKDGTAFPRLSVKTRPEIVSLHLGEKDIDPSQITGVHLKPEILKSWFDEGKEFYIVDMRNDYELKSGKFENTIFPGMKNFRDLREKVNEINNLKDKTVLTVCTGGVRCEKASGFLREQGFNDVYQLDGGIVTYMEKYPGKNFKGSLYVFDKRLTMNFNNPENHEIIGICELCGNKSEEYVNCANLGCHKHFIACLNCQSKGTQVFCNKKCEEEVLTKSI